MSRLYEIGINKKQWIFRGCRNTGYELINKETYDSFSLGNVIGIEQVSNDTFLVHRCIRRNRWQIEKLVFIKPSHKIYQMYCKEFRSFCFLTENHILFDKDFHSLNPTLYCIRNNTEDDFLNRLLGCRLDWKLIKYRYITLLYQTPEEDTYPTALLLEYKFNSHPLDIGAYLQVILDVPTLAPISPVYSSLRDKYFDLDGSISLGQIAMEDSRYAYHNGSFYAKGTRKSPTDLLNMARLK